MNGKHRGSFRRLLATTTALAALALVPQTAWSHGFAGKRFFPTTLAIDDPFVMDEFSLLASHIKEPAAGDEPATLSSEIAGEITKRITPRFGLTLGSGFRHLDPKGQKSADGFGNLEVGAKYQLFTDDAHEALAAIGLEAEVGGTGDRKAGAERVSSLAPVLSFGKGMGDLPESAKYLRPLAVTGVFGAEFPTQGRTVTLRATDSGEVEREIERHATKLRWGLAVQYNLQYLQSFVSDVGLPAPFNRMIPVVEFAMETCLNRDCASKTTGTVNPGVIWFGRYVQLGLSAQVPVNSRTGDNVGVMALFHVFTDDLLPDSLGRPLFGQSTPRPTWWQHVVK